MRVDHRTRTRRGPGRPSARGAASRGRSRPGWPSSPSTPASRASSRRWPTPQRSSPSSSIGSASAISSVVAAQADPEALAQERPDRVLDERARGRRARSPARPAAGRGSAEERAGRGAGAARARAPSSVTRSKLQAARGPQRARREVAGVERLQRMADQDLVASRRPLAGGDRRAPWRRSRRAAHRPGRPAARGVLVRSSLPV